MISNHTFVGMADATLALIQHGTRLYLLDTTAATKEMMYQQVGCPVDPLFPTPPCQFGPFGEQLHRASRG